MPRWPCAGGRGTCAGHRPSCPSAPAWPNAWGASALPDRTPPRRSRDSVSWGIRGARGRRGQGGVEGERRGGRGWAVTAGTRRRHLAVIDERDHAPPDGQREREIRAGPLRCQAGNAHVVRAMGPLGVGVQVDRQRSLGRNCRARHGGVTAQHCAPAGPAFEAEPQGREGVDQDDQAAAEVKDARQRVPAVGVQEAVCPGGHGREVVQRQAGLHAGGARGPRDGLGARTLSSG
jgi:hypothetical protein